MNKKIIKPQTLKGFRDFLPEEMKIRNYVLKTFKQVFKSFGFEPLKTPSLEYSSTLLGKYGKEADKLVYTFKDRGKRDIGLIYDLTVPISRTLALYANNKIPLPFKRYQIQRTWRAEKPQMGRYREILMCDIDIFAIKSPLADAEIIAIIYTALKKLGIQNFEIKINSRQVLFKILKKIGVKDKKFGFSILQSIDKLEKIGEKAVSKELDTKGLSQEKIKILWKEINNASPDENLEKVFNYLESFNIRLPECKFDSTMGRGLDYYTGPIFETIVKKPNIGSISGGGRYDKLISLLGGPDIAATGATIGLDRICEIIKKENLIPTLSKSTSKVLFLNYPGYEKKVINYANQFRKNNINCEVYLEEKNFQKQLKYANKKGVPYVIIIGPDEAKQNKVTLKNMETGKQETLSLEKVIFRLADKK